MKRLALISAGFFALAAWALIQTDNPTRNSASGDSLSESQTLATLADQQAASSDPSSAQSKDVIATAFNPGATTIKTSAASAIPNISTGSAIASSVDSQAPGTSATNIPENAVPASESEQAPPGTVIVPDSSLENPGDIGVRSHTNHLFIKPPDAPNMNPMAAAVFKPSGESPQSIRAVYNLPATGGAGTIAIITAYHYPTALNDFNVFSRQFSLPLESSTNANAATNTVFQVVYATGKLPATDAGWSQESALDIEWSHAMAPNAKIVLVEARSASIADLNQAIQIAGKLPGVRQVSMSWGGSEYSWETANDLLFTTPGVDYFAASGDTGGKTIYPGTSPNVLSAGGTSIHRNSAGVFTSETGWSYSGGGKSPYETRPYFQTRIASIVGTSRGVPDCSFDADPNSGVAVYDSTPYYRYSGWMVFGGTSVSSPSLAGVVNLAGSIEPGTTAELNFIYGNLGTANFRDITSGSAGHFNAQADWDFVTGIGSPLGLNGK
ncbi:MAG: hypothetical protein PHD76_08180 [Methylacidiphilales bacterium]|nr:hypothetical protein [Candidatus Methylacidiphilales bacterium]